MAVRKDDSAVKAVHEALTPHDEAPTVQEDDPDTWSAIMAQEEREAQAEPTAPSSFDVVQAALAHQANNERFAASSVPPGMRRMQITHAFALMRPDGSKISFRPDGTNCDVSGFYDVSNADIDAWPEAFGFTTLKPSDQVDTPDGMIRMHVMSNFLLNRDDHTQVEYKANGTNCGLPGIL